MPINVMIELRPPGPNNPDVGADRAPVEVVALVHELTHGSQPSFSRCGGSPWRVHFELSGDDTGAVVEQLLAELRQRGYDASVTSDGKDARE